jgi:MinD-like ATPase involved in chromosome partitioning or flagellar assembly
VDLPTYTNIWRIEKRLYKLYDLRLPMPLPLVQIGVFLGVFVPWIVLLQLVGIPFGGGWILPLYLVPPAVLTWLATRPVIEGKRLTELLLSQTRYVAEPRTWCRLTPIREPAEVVVVARVWRRAGAPAPVGAPERAAIRGRRKARKTHGGRHAAARPPLSPPPARAPQSSPALPAPAAGPPPIQTSDEPRVQQRVRVRADDTGAFAPPSFGEAPAIPLGTAATAKVRWPDPHEPPPIVPQLDMPPLRATAPAPAQPAAPAPEHEGETAEPAQESAEQSAPAAPRPGPGKRGLVSGVLRGGDVGDTWQAISRTDAEQLAGRTQDQDDSPAPGAVASTGTADSTADDGDGAEAVADGTAAGGGTSADVTPAAETKSRQEETEAVPAEAETKPAEKEAAQAEKGAAPAEKEAPPAEKEAPPAAETKPAETETTSRQPRSVPRPWSKELSRPPRDARTDALVWPPPPHRRAGSVPPKPAKNPQRSSGGQPAKPPRPPAPRQPQPQRPAQDPSATPPTGTPLPGRAAGRPVWGRPTGPVRIPAAGSSQSGLPSRPEGTPIKPPPPRVVPEAELPSAPPREGRSGPASPVRPEPRQRAQPAGRPDGRAAFGPAEGRAASPAITPPDPDQEGMPGGGLRRLLKAMGGGHTEVDSEYEERLQRPFYGARHIVVLGCTGGAGQTVTALMMGHTFAQYCGEPVVAIDVNPGPGALARRTRTQTPETLAGLITRADQVTSLTAVRRYTSRAKSGLDVVSAGKNPVQALDDRDYALAFRTLDHFYSVTMLDTAAAIVARVLPYADQLVLVAPASSDAARAVQMTFEWLDGHGYDELRTRAVTVVNGVSRRSMKDVNNAESVARGRCRALVRIPWDDHLSLDRSPRNELKSLRAPTRRAYLALAGVVAGGFAVVPERYQEREASR